MVGAVFVKLCMRWLLMCCEERLESEMEALQGISVVAPSNGIVTPTTS